MKEKTIKAWCFQNKDTGELEPIEEKKWWDGHSIHGTRKDLLDNNWGSTPIGYKPVRIKLVLKN